MNDAIVVMVDGKPWGIYRDRGLAASDIRGLVAETRLDFDVRRLELDSQVFTFDEVL